MDREAICVILITVSMTICLTCSYDLQCPGPSHWKLRARAKCGNITTYKCLYDNNNEYYVENCTKPDIEAAGFKLVWRGNLDRASCKQNRYQPFIFYTTETSDCSLQKSKCKGEGQLVYDLGKTSEDIQCRCNSTSGYAFVHKPIHPCFCVPSTEDCTCFRKTFLEPVTLSPDYACQNQSIQEDSCSSTYDVNDITTRANSTVLYTSKPETEARLINLLTTVFMAVVYIFIFFVLKYTLNRDIEYFTKTMAKTFECLEGDNVELSCAVYDANIPAYWSKGGKIINSSAKYKITDIGKSHMLSIIQLELKDAGIYSIMINNQMRSSSVQVKEYFTKALGTKACTEGEDVQFECEVLDEIHTATWFKYGIEVSTSDRYKVERHGKVHRLVVNSTKLADKGEYSVRIKNCTRLCKLIVQEYFTKALDTQACIEGENVQFECEVLDDKQTAHWFKDGIEVSTSDRYKVERHGKVHRLVVNSTKSADKGEYSVRIKKCTRLCKLIVQEYFTKALDTQACIEGENVHFECEVLDDKQLAQWFKDGIEVSTSDRYKVERHGKVHRLVVNSTKSADKGEYSVRIKKCTRLCKLIVQELPTAIRQFSEEDKGLYLEIIKSATETRYYIRIVIIGENGVGKTCLLHRLLGEPIGDVKSTDGIDVVHRCKIRLHDGQWIIDKETNKRKDIVTRINATLNAKTSENQQNQPGISKENRQAEMTKISGEGQIEGTKLLALSTEDKDKKKGTEPSASSTDDKDKKKGTEPFAPSTDDKDERKVAGPSTPRTDDKDKMEAIKPSTPSLDDEKQEYELSLPNNEMKSFSESNQLKNTENIAAGLVETSTKIILNELSQFIKDTDTNEKEVLVHLGFWDFAGQKEYYPTHPIFLNPNAVHLLVADITKDIKKINTESGYDQIGEYIDFWFDSIHSCSIKDTKESTEDHLNPPVIVVCTHIDKCGDKLEEDRKFREQLTTLLKNEDKRKHLRRICYISNTESTESAKKDFDYLRQSIFECGKMIETFGEKLPLKWIRLEQALDILCESDMNIMSLADMAVLASEFSIQNEKEVNLFLKYHHKIGNIIYFESLKDHIVLNPKWLADAFRCFIADGEKYDRDLKLTDDWKLLEETGELKSKLIVKLLEKEKERQFDKHKDHILKLLEMFGIIVKLSDEKQNVPTYYMPCMISNTTSINQVCDVFGVLRDTCRRTPWLCIHFAFMPFDFFNHILFHYTKKYLVCTEVLSERRAIYHGIGVFYLDKTHANKFILCFSKNITAMQIWQWTNIEHGKCKSMLEELLFVIHDVMNKCETRKVSYTVKTKCADGDIHITAGQKSYRELTDLGGKEYYCEEHQQMHDASDSFQTWFENYSEDNVASTNEDIKEMDLVKSGTETRYHLRIVIIGENGVGKTCLLRRLLKQSITGVRSTDGIDMHRCRIRLSDGQWIFNKEKVKEPADEIVECEILDFAGEREYYATHPVFLSQNAIYLLVANIMKDVKPITAEDGFDKIGEYVNFWLDTIHSCEVTEESKMETETELNPPTIIVCTGIDKCGDHVQARKDVFLKQLIFGLSNETKKHHLRDLCYVSNTESDEKDFNVLRNRIFKCGKQMKTFAEQLPLKWIRLEQSLDVLREAGVNILSWHDIVKLALKCSIDSEDDINLFLRYQHKVGGVIYFESLKEYIILNQKWLANAFRCLVSDKFDTNLMLTDEWRALVNTGKLDYSLLVKLFEKKSQLDFNKHSSHLLNVMELFGIIVKLTTLMENGQRQILSTYYMPCMISEKASFTDIIDRFIAKKDNCKRTPWLCIEFDFMPLDFFNHIMCYYISQYAMCTEPQTGRMAIYHGMGVFFLDSTKFRKFILCFCKNTIALQIWQWIDMEKGTCKAMLEELMTTIERARKRFETRKVSYTVKLKCTDGNINISAGRHSYRELVFSGDEYFCAEHVFHNKQDFFQTWFEDYTEMSDYRLLGASSYAYPTNHV